MVVDNAVLARVIPLSRMIYDDGHLRTDICVLCNGGSRHGDNQANCQNGGGFHHTLLLNERLYFRRAGALTQQHADRGRCCTVSVTGDRRRRTEVPFALPCAPNQSDVRKSALTGSVSTGCDLSKLWSAAWVGALLQLPNAACLERGGSRLRSYSAGKEGRARVARLARYISGSL